MLNISNIQHFSVGDGQGIRTTVFCKGCHLRCPWCHNPENLKSEPAVLHYRAKGTTEVLGRSVRGEDILDELLEDSDYYEQSGGGVTFSGGEAMLQAAELVPLVRRLHECGVSVLVDTAGCVPYTSFQLLNPYVAGYLLDFKTADAEKYRQIGGSLSRVTENLCALRRDGIPVRVRIPLIPHFNTDADAVRAICERLREIGVDEVDLLPFHRLGSAKYEAMGLTYAYAQQRPLSAQELADIEKAYRQYFTVKTER